MFILRELKFCSLKTRKEEFPKEIYLLVQFLKRLMPTLENLGHENISYHLPDYINKADVIPRWYALVARGKKCL